MKKGKNNPTYRKVEIAEGELLANKEGLQFFEISAKTNHNVRKMFFSVVAELPIFEDLNEVKAKLINDLEDENNESRVETTTQNDEYIQTHLQMTNKKLSNNTKASKCRC